MKIINKSRKIIGINGEPLLPGADLELPEGMETHPVISYYLQKGIVVDSQNVSAEEKTGISDLEKARIEEEAIAKYKAEQEKAAKTKEAEIKAVKTMKEDDVVDELFNKVKTELIGLIGEDSSKGEMCLDLLMIAKYFERIGDHATNIAEWVEYSITGVHIED